MVIEVVINLILAYLAIGIAGLNTELLTKLETIGLFVSIILGSIISVPLLTMVDYLLFRSLQESKK
jgi:thiamine transporter ThiT